MRLLEAFRSDRFGPDLILTHWMLHFNITNKYLTRNKLGKLGEGAEIRPQVTIIGGKNVFIGKNVVLTPGTYLNAAGGKIVIEDNVLLGPNVYMSTTKHHYEDITKPVLFQGHDFTTITIKQDSWIGASVIIFNDVTIGQHAVIGAGSVVRESIPDYCVAAGVPAKVIRKLK